MSEHVRVYDDFHLRGAPEPEWRQRYQQLSPGRMRSRLVQAAAHRACVYDKWMSERVAQQGCLPAGRICFSILGDAVVPGPRVQGREMTAGTLLLVRGGEQFDLQRPAGMHLISLTFDRDAFDALVEARGWSPAATRNLARATLAASPQALDRLRRRLRRLVEPLRAPVGPVPQSRHVFDALAVFADLSEFFEGACEGRRPMGERSAAYAVAECHRIALDSGETPPDVDALCRRLGISRRTLQYSFRRVADMSPIQYLRGLRLNLVRQRLRETRSGELTIAQAAAAQGFEQMSHFADRFRELFGELPSSTPRARGAESI